MRYSAEHKDQTRLEILRAAGRGFRKEGFGGIGVDGLARGAGVTSGAFYGHFKSKIEAFRAALAAGLDDLASSVVAFRAKHGAGWVEAFIRFYFTDRVSVDLAEGCALPSLSGDVSRADPKTRAAFEKGFLGVVEALAEGLPSRDPDERFARAVAMAAMFAGGVTLARSVRDRDLRDRISRILLDATTRIARDA